MGSDGKGGGGSIKNYYGTIAGVICAGPVDELVALVMDGATIWPTNKHWADNIIDLTPVSYQRKLVVHFVGIVPVSIDQMAYVTFGIPHGLTSGQKFVLTGMADASFNCAVPTTVASASTYTIVYKCAGPDTMLIATNQGSLTKSVHYQVGDLVIYAGGIWRALVAHDGVIANAPPNATYWASVSITRAGSANPYPFTVDGYGQAYFYWGTTDQTLDTVGEVILAAGGHPPYRRQAVIVLKNFLFGTERQAAPNIEVVVRRSPVQTLVVGAPAGLDADKQANPVAVLAEVLTDPVFGLGISNGKLDAASWGTVADALNAVAAQSCLSPLIDTQDSMRSFIAELLAYFDGWVRWNGSGVLEMGRFLHNEAPPAFDATTTITYHDLLEEIAFDSTGWTDTFNQTIVKFQDQARAWKDASQQAVSGFNRNVVGEPRQASLDRPWITREAQAATYAAEWGKINAQPLLQGTLVVRAEKAAAIKEGTLFLLTHDALAYSVICRCTERTIAAPPAGRVTLSFQSERGMPPIPYQPAAPANDGPAVPHPEFVEMYRFVQPPPALAGGSAYELYVLAARRSVLTLGLNVWLRVDDAVLFYQLGEQRQWAVVGMLSQAYGLPTYKSVTERSRAAGVATLTVVAHGMATGLHVAVGGVGGTGYDLTDVMITDVDVDHISYRCGGADEAVTADTTGGVQPLSDDESENLQINLDEFTVQGDIDRIAATQSADATNDNAVLVWLFRAADPTQFEIATLRAVRLDGGVYKLKLRRGQYGTTPLTFAANDTAWIVTRSDLVGYTHAYFADYAVNGTSADFRLQAFTAEEDADLTDADLCPDLQYTFRDVFAPTVSWLSLQELLPGGTTFSEIADFTAGFARQTRFSFSWRMDSLAGLAHADLVAQLGSTQVNLWSQDYQGTTSEAGQAVFSLPDIGTWRIFCDVRDTAGRLRQFELAPVGGGAAVSLLLLVPDDTCELPVISSIRGPGLSRITFGITSPTTLDSAGHIWFQACPIGQSPAAGTWLDYADHCDALTGEVTIHIGSSISLYAYVTDTNYLDSPVIRQDFTLPTSLG
jgi:hypothetical protein